MSVCSLPERDPLIKKQTIPHGSNSSSNIIYSTEGRFSPTIHESQEGRTVRRPVEYHSIAPSRQRSMTERSSNTKASVSRYKYYGRLQEHSQAKLNLLMPSHVVPPEFFLVIPFKSDGEKQSSLVTIFSIWNTMMGTSLLTIPWAMQQAGFGLSLFLILGMVLLCLYTAHKVMNSVHYINASGDVHDFSEICRFYLGKWGDYLTVLFSFVTLLGAAVIYWVLMSNFLFHFGNFIYEHAYNSNSSTVYNLFDNRNGSKIFNDVICPKLDNLRNISLILNDKKHTGFHKYWDQKHTVPFMLLLILGPLINFKSPTFFTKFNSLGTVSIAYILTFVIIKGSKWGINVDFIHTDNQVYIAQYHLSSFPALTGILTLALFIHNCVITVVKNQKYPENNSRDLIIAYICVGVTYFVIGIVFYITFPLSKQCIEDNLLNNLKSTDILSLVARLFLLFQMCTVFPLITFIMRAQVLHTIFGSVYPGLRHVLVFNFFIVTVCLLFAVFMPKVGVITRFSGAICGLAYVFTLPCIIHMLWLKSQRKLNWKIISLHTFIILFGCLSLVGQFIVKV